MCVRVFVVCRSVDRVFVCNEIMESSVYYAMCWVVYFFLYLLTSVFVCVTAMTSVCLCGSSENRRFGLF